MSSGGMPTIKGPLVPLLARIASKVNERTTRPWYDLQRTYFYRDQAAITTREQLKFALRRFHVVLSDDDVNLIWETFPLYDSFGQKIQSFDFKLFVAAMLKAPPPDNNLELRNGRLVEKDAPVFFLHPPRDLAQSTTIFDGHHTLPFRGSSFDSTVSNTTSSSNDAAGSAGAGKLGSSTLSNAGAFSVGSSTNRGAGGGGSKSTRTTGRPAPRSNFSSFNFATQQNQLPHYMQSKHQHAHQELQYHVECISQKSQLVNNNAKTLLKAPVFKSYPVEEYRLSARGLNYSARKAIGAPVDDD